MSAAAVVLPYIWAVGDQQGIQRGPVACPRRPVEISVRPVEPQMAFYRKYTEAMLRRYVRMSMEAGRVPSLLGKEMFRGNVTRYRVEGFDDVVIFIHDVKKCIEKLSKEQQDLISRVALQEYSLGETAELLGLKPRTVIRRYGQTVDCLTRIFLRAKLLEPLKCCQ